MRFRYRLDGFDPDWVDAGRAPAGVLHESRARAATSFACRPTATAARGRRRKRSGRSRVQPAFRQTGWFYALCGIGAAARGVGRRADARLDSEPAVRGDARRAHAPEPRDSRHDAAEPRRHRAAGAGDRAAVRAGRRSEQQSQLVALQAPGRAVRPRGPPGDLRTCARPCSRRAASRARSPRSAAARSGRRRASTCRPTPIDGRSRRPPKASCCASRRRRSRTPRGMPARRASTWTCIRRRTPSACASPTTAADSTSTRCRRPATGHYGLTGMRERAARVGGRLTVTSSTGGTVVEAIVPCARQRA